MRWMRSLLAVAFLLATNLLQAALAQDAARGLLAAEPKLDQPVTLSARAIYLGELLDRITEETGVHLEASDRIAPLSGYRLAIVVNSLPAREVLEALPRLYSFPPDRWYWAREGSGDRRKYVLHNTHSPGLLKQLRREYTAESMVHELRTKSEFYSLPPDRREQLAKKNPALRIINNPRAESLHSFLSPLIDNEIRSVIGGKPLQIPVGQLSPEQFRAIEEEYRLSNKLGKAGVMQPSELDHVTLYRSDNPGRAPVVGLSLGAVGSHGVLGGMPLDAELRERTRKNWSTKGDTSTAESKTVPASTEGSSPGDLRVNSEPAAHILERLGKKAAINLLFDDPLIGGALSHPDGIGGPLPEVLARLSRLSILWKRRDPFYLFRMLNFPEARRDALVPWPFIRELRVSADKGAGYLQPEDWMRMSELSRAQLEFLSREFPDANQVRNFQLLLRLAAQMTPRERAAIARDEGAGWDDYTDATRERLRVLLTPAEAMRSRLLIQWKPDARPPVARFYMSAEGGPIQAVEVKLQPRVEINPNR